MERDSRALVTNLAMSRRGQAVVTRITRAFPTSWLLNRISNSRDLPDTVPAVRTPSQDGSAPDSLDVIRCDFLQLYERL